MPKNTYEYALFICILNKYSHMYSATHIKKRHMHEYQKINDQFQRKILQE